MIEEYLKKNYPSISENEPIVAESLCKALNITIDPKRTLRKMVVDEICNNHALIGSYNGGYFYITNEKALELALNFLKSIFADYKKRISCLEFNYKVRTQGELGI